MADSLIGRYSHLLQYRLLAAVVRDPALTPISAPQVGLKVERAGWYGLETVMPCGMG